MYIGHKREDGKVQPLQEHLLGVAKLAEAFAQPFGAGEHARRTGLLHDIGKYAPDVQRRMADPDKYRQKVNHTSAGAKIAFNQLQDLYAAFAIAGHHGGLSNSGSGASMPQDGTLRGKLKYIPEDYSAYAQEISLPAVTLPQKRQYEASFYTRMLFSCLVDADFLDTETFMRGEPAPRGQGDSIDVLLERLQAYIGGWFPPKGAINEKRCAILQDCLAAGSGKQGLYTLTVPTGGGKTVSSLAFALSHAKEHALRRVIYVVPYTSIIEQNAAKFAEILGDENVLEHHSGVEYTENPNDEDQRDESARMLRKRLATENWDAPVIVTTAVQFFESLYAAQTSRCRKLHNIARSVIVFDEAQMMPLAYLAPCVAAIAQLVVHYGATAVLCTATQPALDTLFHQYAPQLTIREIVREPQALYEFFRRVRFEQEGTISCDALADCMSESEQVLCIVNTRARAQQVYDLLPEAGRFHLSTFMTPRDRRKALDEIRARLKAGKPCRVVSTSLIEAGVDVDFPCVWREEAGLDSILQAAGRCNREGKRSREESVVHVFVAQEGSRPDKRVSALHDVLDRYAEMDSLPAIERYFRYLFHAHGQPDKKEILRSCKELDFRTASDRFQMIESDTVTVYIPCPDNAQLLHQLRTGEYDRRTIRALQKDGVNVYDQQYRQMAGAGEIETTQDGYYILADVTQYDAVKGLDISCDPGKGIFI